MSSHRHRRVCFAAILIGLVGVWAPVRVDAHAEFENAPASVDPDSDIALTLFVEDERDAATYNAKVAIRLPEGWTGVACESKPTWTCAIAVESQRVVIRFTKGEGAAPAEDETFNLTLHSGTNLGTATFPVLQTYNTGEEVGWIGDPGLDNEAPTLEVAGDVPTTPTTLPATSTTIPPATTVAPTSAPTTVAATVAPTAPAPSTTATTASEPTDTAVILVAPTPTQPSEGESDEDSAATIILIVLVLAAAGAAMFYYWKQRRPPTPPA
jgi:hypothetical protein